MRRMKLIKLLVLNKQKNEAREITFKDGLNIIYGENKTGKSSLIKSIFYTLGCESPVEKEWKELISDYILEFSFNGNQYIVHRRDNSYSILNKKNYEFIIENSDYTEFCINFMRIFNINIKLIHKSTNSELPIPPAAILNYHYIDQDDGWNYKIPNSFSNVKHYKDIKNVIRYVAGEHNNKYFALKATVSKIKTEISLYKSEIHSIM